MKPLLQRWIKWGKNFPKKIFVPQMLLSAKAMNVSMEHLKPYFADGSVKRKGVFILGTVFGDLHDIGKNLVGMMIEGAGWEVIDLGVDVKIDTFVNKVKEYPGSPVGISALLSTTMINIKPVIEAIKTVSPKTKVIVGGAPLSCRVRCIDRCRRIWKNPLEGIKWLESTYRS